MLYRLAFGITGDGHLRVAASAKGQPEVSTIHLNDEVFAVVVRAAQMAPFQTVRLLEAAREARRQPGMDICCEAVELTPMEIEALCLRPGRDKIA
jgi:hypothetical protein